MQRCTIFPVFLALFTLSAAGARAQSVSVYQTTPDLVDALSPHNPLHFSAKADAAATAPLITVDDAQRFQEIDGFGASLTDSAAWLFNTKLSPLQTDAAFKTLFSRKNGIALSFLRQPVGSSDLAVAFYSLDDLCQQTAQACTSPASADDFGFAHYTLQHDQQAILPLLKKALALNPSLRIMLTPWSPPGWMKSSGSMLGSNPETKKPSTLRPEASTAFALYLVKTIEGYQAVGVPVYALSVQNEPLYAPPTYSGMTMTAAVQADFLADTLGPSLAEMRLDTKVMVYDHNWDHPEYPETVLKYDKARAVAAGTAWHH